MPNKTSRAVRAHLLCFAIAASSTLSFIAHAEEANLCVAGACLGMTAAQAAQLNLTPNGNFFALNVSSTLAPNSRDQWYGLDAKGKTLWFSGANGDKKSLSEFSEKVKTVCKLGGAWAFMKASDGQKIQLNFRPVIREGRSELIVTEITRTLPPNLSQSEKNAFIAQAKERYADAWTEPYASSGVKKQKATVKTDATLGYHLRLDMPFNDADTRIALMAQPGCSSKATLD